MKLDIAMLCCEDCDAISSELRYYLKRFPLLENVTITDTGKRGRLSLCGQDIVRDNKKIRLCYVPLLKLPVTGYMMKGVFLAIFEMFDLPGGDSSVNMNLNDFEDKEEAAYNEAVMEIFKRNRGWKEKLL
ncbi:F-box domain, Leucine-rich repeat domain, L domain-like protein [Artemisia annua]|uniref:F-box domain, Leucine-rich repeat domain, L domain-like protein n=1 Tax=Artemisia annua TaxID=35608 RepID=A0A2U1KY43_ARTAN|nr:F-box domain, Leucine-rich repeat domain, L domain-like protein [Artemisia annua]